MQKCMQCEQELCKAIMKYPTGRLLEVSVPRGTFNTFLIADLWYLTSEINFSLDFISFPHVHIIHKT